MINKLNAIEKKFEEVNVLLADPAIIADQAVYQKHAKMYRDLSSIVEKFREYKNIIKGIEDARALCVSETDSEMRKLADDELISLQAQEKECMKELQWLLMPKDPNDDKNVLVEIRAGTGGNESTLFAAELFRMYSRFAERNGWRIEIMEEHASEVGGYKEIIAMIEGVRVFSKLKYESGVHRVQRVPATEANGASTLPLLPSPSCRKRMKLKSR
jgi:peptide chain release factor 1